MRNHSLAALAPALILGAALRALRVGARWDELTLAYAAYMEPLAAALQDGHPSALVGSWTGLHPPLYGTLHAVLEVAWPVPLVWLCLSALTSLGAAAVVGRTAGPVAALVLATAPVHLMDAAEINNYPLASLSIAVLIWAARRSWGWLAAAALFAAWSHLLGGVAAAGVVGWRLSRGPSVDRWSLLAASALGMLPIVGGVMRLMQMDSTWSQPSVDLLAWMLLVARTVGPEAWLMAPVVLLGLRRELAAGGLALGGALLLATVLGAAAAHQRPYLGLLAPIAAVAVGQAVRSRPRLGWVVVALCLVRGVRVGAAEVDSVQRLVADQDRPRAIDAAIASSEPGDTLWLVAPALQPDDDKSDTSAVLWRLSPWASMPIARPVRSEYKDYRFGHPRHWQERVVHTSTELDEAAFDAVAAQRLGAGGRLFIVLYDHAPAHGLKARIERVMRPYEWVAEPVGEDRGLGADWLYRVDGRL
jgi:hypothetical protein